MTKLILPAVAAAIFNDKGEILLQKRKDTGKWCLISGHIEFGESATQAIVREIREETNANAIVTRFIGIYSAPDSQTYIYSDRIVQYLTIYFEAKLIDFIFPGFSNNETQELMFFPTADIPADLAVINPYWLTDAMDTPANYFIR